MPPATSKSIAIPAVGAIVRAGVYVARRNRRAPCEPLARGAAAESAFRLTAGAVGWASAVRFPEEEAMSDELLRDLTEAQREAVLHVEGPLLILAGPGQRQDPRHHPSHRLAAGPRGARPSRSSP